MTTHEAVDVRLPTFEDVGRLDYWVLPSGDGVVRIDGTFLGVSTTRQAVHHHRGRAVDVASKCRACRWFEPRIFRENEGRRRYLIHRTGRSRVPGEVTLTSHEWVLTPFEVVEVLTTRRRDPATGDRTPYLTQPAARVLAQAADLDEDLARAYVGRAVA